MTSFIFSFSIFILEFYAVSSVKTANLGILLPSQSSYPFDIAQTTTAIDLAIETIEKLHVLPNHHLSKQVHDSNCSLNTAPVEAVNLYMKREVDVFLGPVCDFAVAPVARLASSWSIPIISAGALATAFADKTKYKTLTRVQGPYSKNAKFVWDIARIFNWSRIALLFNDDKENKDDRFTMEPIFYMFNEFGHRPWYRSFDERNPLNLRDLLMEASMYARIVVLCASADSVRDILIKAHELNFDNGEYVFLNIDLFSSKNESERPWYRANDTPERNEKAKKAYEALMTVTLRKPTSKDYKKFSTEVKRRAKEKNVNFTYGEEEVNSFVGAFHDAVILYAIALNETLAANKSITDGAEITKRMWNRTFEGITGTVSIDDNGDRNADYSLLDMNPNTHKFEVVANYFGKDKEYKAVRGKHIHWAGGRTSAPPDTPKCGFDGSKCPPDKSGTTEESTKNPSDLDTVIDGIKEIDTLKIPYKHSIVVNGMRITVTIEEEPEP